MGIEMNQFWYLADYMRVSSFSRFLCKGVFLQISEQIQTMYYQLMISNNGVMDIQQETKLNSMVEKYSRLVLDKQSLIELEIQQIQLYQKIQYNFKYISEDSTHVFQRDFMRTFACHFQDLVQKKIGINNQFLFVLQPV